MIDYLSLHSNHKDVIESDKKKVQVDCVDIARILRQYEKKDFVILKMDIEGSEYETMLHLYKNNALDLVDIIALEKHPYVNPFNSNDIIDYLIKKSGVEVVNWI